MAVYQIKLLARHQIATDTYELQFTRPTDFNFIPGQYAAFRINHPELTNQLDATRRFSLLSTPHDTIIKIALRLTPSTYKRIMSELSLGTELTMIGPAGKFILHSDPTVPTIFLAGGIGITPFYSMLHQQLHTQPANPHNITLFYVNQSIEYAPYLTELNVLATNNFQFIPTITRSNPIDWLGESGGFTQDLLLKYLPSLIPAIYYVCGSQAMVNHATNLLLDLGITAAAIKSEDFPGYNL